MKCVHYDMLKEQCERLGVTVREAYYLGYGILGRFFPPNTILINTRLCNEQKLEQQKPVLVLLHEMCHWFKWQEHPDKLEGGDEETCFEFEVVCDRVLNHGESPTDDFEAVKRLGLDKPMEFLNSILNEVR